MSLEHADPTHHPKGATSAIRADQSVRDVLDRLIATTESSAPAILRLTLGGVMLPHAFQKTLGLFGGSGLSATMQTFTAQLHLPTTLAAAAIVFEQVGALALVLGVFTRLAAAAMGVVMVGAILTVHLRNGFFMNWFGTQAGEGYEYHLLVLAMVAALIIEGGGKLSVDSALLRSRNAA